MAKFTVYKTESCPYCQSAMQFLAALKQQRDDVTIKLVDGNREPQKVANAQRKVGRTTVPQIFVDGNHIGGWDDLSRWAQTGALDSYLDGGAFTPPQAAPGLFARLFGRKKAS